jgi:hypothetical protein
MGKFTNLVGQQKNSLTVIAQAEKDTRLNRIMWSCQCECGKTIKVCTGDWNAGRAKSCGCYRSRKGVDHPNFRHGLTKTTEYQYKQSIKKRYGLTFEEYELLHDLQGGVCAICGEKQKDKRGTRLVVDHCHKTKRIRGLLCNKCNRAIGLLRDNSQIISQAHNYVKRNEVSHVSAQ